MAGFTSWMGCVKVPLTLALARQTPGLMMWNQSLNEEYNSMYKIKVILNKVCTMNLNNFKLYISNQFIHLQQQFTRYVVMVVRPSFHMMPINHRLIVGNHWRRKLFQMDKRFYSWMINDNRTRRLSASYGNKALTESNMVAWRYELYFLVFLPKQLETCNFLQAFLPCSHQADIRMRSHRLLQLDDNKSAASCQQAWCKFIVKTFCQGHVLNPL